MTCPDIDGYLSGNLTIPASVTYSGNTYSVVSIGSEAFNYCRGLTSVTIPNSVTSIGSYAFSFCTGLTSVTIPNTVTSIGNYAFYGCTGLTSVTIPNSVTRIEMGTFGSCNIASVTIPNSVTYIHYSAFGYCRGVTSIVVYNGNTYYDSRDNCNAIIETSTNTLILGCQNTIIPNSVTSIGEHAFESRSGLTSVTIPNSVTSIGRSAFQNCTGLTSITIPNSVTSIDFSAFSGCTGLTNVTIPNSVTRIENGTFRSCNSLASVTIPNSVTSIGQSSFQDCSGMTSITIGSSVASIDNAAFYNCSSLEEVYSFASIAPLLGNNAFNGVPSTIPVHIPCGSQMSYYSRWSYFSNFIEAVAFDFCVSSTDTTMGNVVTLTQPTCSAPTAVFNAVPNSGYRFDHWSDGNTDNPRSLTVIQDTSITAYFLAASNSDTVYIHDTIFIHDTIYLHDTIVVGVDEVDAINAKIYVGNGQIVVEGAESNTVWLYDVNGRIIATQRGEAVLGGTPIRFVVPTSGSYMVKIGNHPVRKVVVIR